MNIIKRQIRLPGGRIVDILLPENSCPDITATDDGRGYYYLLSNGTGYSLMTDIFALATALEKDELIYFPLTFSHPDDYRNDFPSLENHYHGITLVNFHAMQISAKDISTALKTKTFSNQKLICRTPCAEEYPERWEVRHKLTVKSRGRILILSGERAVFTSMAQSCANLSKYGDDPEYNKCPPHMHHDWAENTAKSVGITFYYWQSGGKDVHICS